MRPFPFSPRCPLDHPGPAGAGRRARLTAATPPGDGRVLVYRGAGTDAPSRSSGLPRQRAAGLSAGSAPPPRPVQPIGGRHVWFVDPARGALTACRPRQHLHGRRHPPSAASSGHCPPNDLRRPGLSLGARPAARRRAAAMAGRASRTCRPPSRPAARTSATARGRARAATQVSPAAMMLVTTSPTVCIHSQVREWVSRASGSA